jgi:hypothetical protein
MMTMNGRRILGIISVFASIIFLVVMVPGIEENRFHGNGNQFYTVGPRVLPYFAGIFTLLMSFCIVLTKTEEEGNNDPKLLAGLGRALVFMIIMLGFSVGILYLGFMISAILFLASTFFYFRAGSPFISTTIAVAAPIVVDLLLRKVFLIPLPIAPFF